VVVIGAVVSFFALTHLDDDSTEILDRISPARIEAADLTTAYVDQETGVRGFVLSRDPSFLEPYTTGQQTAKNADAAIRDHIPTPAVAAALDRVAAAGEAWHRDFADKAIKRTRAAGPTGKVSLNEELGQRRFDAIRTATDQLADAIAAERVRARERVDHGITWLWVLLGLAFGAVLVVGFLIWLALRRLVLSPLSHLAAETRTVAEGDFQYVVKAGGPAEIRALGVDVEGMRQQLAEALFDAQRVEGEVRAQAELLAVQAEDLQRSNEELEQFAYVASHDLQEPLRKVASFCQMLQRRYGGQLDERADQYIEFAVDGAKRMQQLINDLLAFSRVGRTTDRMVPVDTQAAAERALHALADVQEEAGAVVEIGDLPTVPGDEALLTQVFQNLIGNAIKFRSPDRPAKVRVSAERDDDFWHFRCEDNGIGIDPQYADRIFVIFQRLHSKDQYSGTGIGLSLCKKIVEYHGGRIWLDTDRDGAPGSVVHWTLPVAGSDSDDVAEGVSEDEAITTPIRKVSLS
jgi:signal transduction histidine kinase